MNLGPSVREIASVSECIASGPPDWIDGWAHNAAFFYDSPNAARQMVSPDDAPSYDIYAYELCSEPYGISHVEPIDTAVHPSALPSSFVSLGFDVVGRDYAASFECSPLSCNGMADEMTVNEFCLIRTFEDALSFAQRCGESQPEPGEYVVIRVWREDANQRVAGA
jgi:hypothetical protein